jgi:hypothetical protein
MIVLARALARDRRASSAAEFALVLPLLSLLVVGMIDVGRLMWTWNRAEKATHAGVRFAAVTDMVPQGLYAADFLTGRTQGDPIPADAFSGATCSSSGGTVSCTCVTGGTCPTLTPVSTDAFNNIVARMQRYMPELTADNVEVDYRSSGLGYAGTPAANGPSIVPIVSVSIKGFDFRPLSLVLFNTDIPLGTRSAELTVEDSQGNSSY